MQSILAQSSYEADTLAAHGWAALSWLAWPEGTFYGRLQHDELAKDGRGGGSDDGGGNRGLWGGNRLGRCGDGTQGAQDADRGAGGEGKSELADRGADGPDQARGGGRARSRPG